MVGHFERTPLGLFPAATRDKMEMSSLKNRTLFALSLSAVFFLSVFSSVFSQEAQDSIAFTLEGNPVLVSSRGEALQMRGRMALHSNERVQTGLADRALIQISGDESCRFILEPGSVIVFGGQAAGHTYRVHLIKWTLKGRTALCGSNLILSTSEGSLWGNQSSFRILALKGKTTIFFKSGNMRFFIGGEVIPIRAMTRTTISRSGIHRISSMARIQPRAAQRAGSGANSGSNSPLQRTRPIAATVNQP